MRLQTVVDVVQERTESGGFPLNLPKRGRVLASIAALDLTQVRRKLMEPAPEGKGWSEAYSLEVEKWYRRFLHITQKYPEVSAVPNYPIDMFWHQHILDTQAYAVDCQTVFGHFLHHYPYFGLNGDSAERDVAFVDTNALYRTEFDGEDCTMMHQGMVAENCKPPCNAELCKAGCKRPYKTTPKMASCTGRGSGTGCRQGCSRGR